MIETIVIKNLKAFDEVCVPCRPITLIYGPNSSGKSTIIQSLMLLKQTVASEKDALVSPGDYADLGGFYSLIHKHEMSRRLSITVIDSAAPSERFCNESGIDLGRLQASRVSYGVDPQRPDGEEVGVLMTVCYFVRPPVAGKVLHCCLQRDHSVRQFSDHKWKNDFVETALKSDDEFKWGESVFGSYSAWFWGFVEQQFLKAIGRTRDVLTQSQADAFDRFRHMCDVCSHINAHGALPGMVEALPAFAFEYDEGSERREAWEHLQAEFPQLADWYANEDEIGCWREWESKKFDVLGDRLRSLLNRTEYIGPLRELPERAYCLRDLKEKTGAAGNQYVVRVLHERSDLIPGLNWWLQRFEIPYEVGIVSRNDRSAGTSIQLSLTDKRSGAAVSLKDVGFGISQMLPILVKGMISHDGILCCEQPELHLHPRLQAQMADFFIGTADVVVSDAKSTTFSDFPTLELKRRGMAWRGSGKGQWIIETHSELLILRIQRRIREGILKADDVCVLYVDSDNDGARVKRLRLDEKGEFIDEWPDGFFDDGYLEIYPPRRS